MTTPLKCFNMVRLNMTGTKKNTWKLPSWELISIFPSISPIPFPGMSRWFSRFPVVDMLVGEYHQGSLYDQPKQCTIIREILQNYNIFALFDAPKMGNLITPDHFLVSMLIFGAVSIHLPSPSANAKFHNSWNDAQSHIAPHRWRSCCFENPRRWYFRCLPGSFC